MPKRKLKSSSIGGGEQKKKHSKCNPFLQVEEEDDDERKSAALAAGSQDDLLAHTVVFIEIGKHPSESDQKKAYGSLAFLLKFLEGHFSTGSENGTVATTANPGDVDASVTRTTTILLPWIIRKLLETSSNSSHNKDEVLLWRGLALSLMDFADGNNENSDSHFQMKQNVLKQTLNSKVLLKLVPHAATIALAGGAAGTYATKCYTMLLQGHFVPSVDVACKSLFFGVVNGISDENLLGKGVRASSITTKTLQVLKDALKQANPKTAFQVVSTLETLVAFSKAYFYFEDLAHKDDRDSESQQLVVEILSENLFHPEHHLEGFRSIVQLRGVPEFESSKPKEEKTAVGKGGNSKSPKQSKFQCYQENLLGSLQELLMIPDTNTAEAQSEQTMLIARLLPVLFRGFLEKLAVFDDITKQTSLTTKRGGSKFDLAQTQLFFFATASVPLWHLASQSVAKNIRSFALGSLSLCLQLLAQHDAFVYSDADKNRIRFNLLETLTVGAIETPWPNRNDSENATVIVETLVRLDHRLVDDRLETVILFCATRHLFDDDTANPQTRNLLVALIKSYQQLRRFSYVFATILTAVSTLQDDKKKTSLEAVSLLLSHSRVQHALAEAGQDNPSTEMKNMFEVLNKWILAASASKDNDVALSIVIRHVSVGLLASVRVDKSTATDIAKYCQLLMQDSVVALCDDSNDEGSLELSHRIKLGVTLCAWVISLQMRGAFWLGHEFIHRSETESKMPQRIRQLLVTDNESGTALSVNASKPVPDDLMLLASFRLRQLDYLVHEQHFGESEELSLQEQYKDEAERLAKLMVQWACDSAESSRWHHIAQIITSWVPYVEEEQLRSFLMWFYSALADANVQQGALISVYPGERQVQISVYEQEKAVAIALTKDTSFFEIDELSDLFVPCALSTVALLIQRVADDATLKSNPEVLAAVRDKKWSVSPSDQFAVRLKWDTTIRRRKKATPGPVVNQLRGALRLVKFLNSLPTQRSTAVAVDCADSALRLEAYCRRHQSIDHELSALMQDLISALRIAAAKSLSSAPHEALAFILKPTDIVWTLECMQGTSEHMLDLFEDPKSEPARRYIFATEKLAFALVGCNLRGTSDGSVCTAVLEHLVTALTPKRKQSDAKTIAAWVHGKASFEALSSTKQIFFAGDSSSLSKTMVSLVDKVDKLRSLMVSPLLRFHGCLVTGAMFRFISLVCPYDIRTHLAERVNSVASSLLSLVLEEYNSVGHLDAAHYMISCFALTKPPVHQRQPIIEQLLGDGCQSTWLEASMCSLVRDIEGDALFAALSSIKQRVESDGSGNGLRLFQVMLHALESEEQIEVVSGFAETMLQHALEAFDVTIGKDDTGENIATASSLINDLTSNRQLLSVKERDIALVLAQTSKVMSFANQDNTVTSSCFSVVATLVQRFPKQLHTCVPSLIAMLHSFLRHVLYERLDEVTLRDRSQKFTRLIEILLPHKEIYKKHVICLLLEFVHCLERDLDLFRKECLLPSIFYLLDMLSKYEMEQLNILMDTSAKTLFRSVHQNYQKIHAYKGQ